MAIKCVGSNRPILSDCWLEKNILKEDTVNEKNITVDHTVVGSVILMSEIVIINT